MNYFLKLFLAITIFISCSFCSVEKYKTASHSMNNLAKDSVLLGSFEIEVKLSDKAKKELKVKKESVIVAAYLSGTPKDPKKYMEDGEYPVGTKSIELFNSTTAAFSSVKITKARYESLTDKDVEVTINIYSGRHSSKLNILDGGMLQKKISEMNKQKFVMKVKLIGE